MFTSMYRMSKDIVDIECSFVSLLGNVEFEAAHSIYYLGGRGGLYALFDVRRVIKVFQNWFIGIPNQYRSSRVG